MSLGLCAIFKDEGPYMAEWLAFYRTQGVDVFYLYDNDSSDGGCRDRGSDVQVIPWPGKAKQFPMYWDCLRRCETEWLAFLDLDEFMYHPDGSTLADAVACHTPFSAIWAPWRMFGWGPHLTKPRGGVVESYVLRATDDHPHHAYSHGGKTIVRPSKVESFSNPHHFAMQGGSSVTDYDSGMLVNHYFTRSREEAKWKCARGRTDTGAIRNWQTEFEDMAADYAAVEDDRLAQLVRRRREVAA
jgi:hypothetical protein